MGRKRSVTKMLNEVKIIPPLHQWKIGVYRSNDIEIFHVKAHLMERTPEELIFKKKDGMYYKVFAIFRHWSFFMELESEKEEGKIVGLSEPVLSKDLPTDWGKVDGLLF